jgi:hypothetical protein
MFSCFGFWSIFLCCFVLRKMFTCNV